jgi:ComF family protein
MGHPLVARLHHVAHALTGAGLSLLFPPRCVGCGRIGAEFCAVCAQAVEATPYPQCGRCGLHLPSPTLRCPNCARYKNHSLVYTRAAALHTSPLRDAIHAFKYESQPTLAPLLARYLVAAYAGAPWSKLPQAITAVVPVPLHEQRLAERGYNQAQLLAESFCRVVGLPVQPAWLERIRETRQQVGLGPSERRANVAGAFAATSAVAGQCLLLIDDVYTTGATLRACAESALAAGSHAVYGLTLARPVQNPHFLASGAGDVERQGAEMPWWEAEL